MAANADEIVRLTDKDAIFAFLTTDPYLYLYNIGDLDDFFWNRTTWYGLCRAGRVQSISMIYEDPSVPVLLGLSDRSRETAAALLQGLLPSLPPRLYAHLSPGLGEILASRYALEPHGRYKKMKLVELSARGAAEPRYAASTRVLTGGDIGPIQALYEAAYPGNWFDPRMLETGSYYGAFHGDDLVAIAGVHVLSARYDAAALGNIATHPEHRGRGYGASVTASLVKSLLTVVSRIGLNVRADNHAAIRCYEALGFRMHSDYDEYMAGPR